MMSKNQINALRASVIAMMIFMVASGALASPELPEMSVYQVQSIWRDTHGKETFLSSLAGKPQIVAMVYSSCPGACPLIIADMQAIRSRLPKQVRDKVGMTLLSIDPERDTPERLREFAEGRRLNPAAWTLLTGSEDAVLEISAVLGFKYKRNPDGNYSHSNQISVLDADGVIRFQTSGLQQDIPPAADAVTSCFVSTERP